MNEELSGVVTQDEQPESVRVLVGELEVGLVQTFKNPNGTYSLELIYDIERKEDGSANIRTGHKGHASRFLLPGEKVDILRSSIKNNSGSPQRAKEPYE